MLLLLLHIWLCFLCFAVRRTRQCSLHPPRPHRGCCCFYIHTSSSSQRRAACSSPGEAATAVYFRQKFRTFRTTTTTASLSLLFFFSQPLYNQRPTSPSDRRARLRRSKAGCATAVSQCTATCLGSHRLSAYFLRPESSPFTNTPYTYLHTHNYRGIVHFLLYFFNF